MDRRYTAQSGGCASGEDDIDDKGCIRCVERSAAQQEAVIVGAEDHLEDFLHI
jgi:hypothetical protein